MTNAAVQKEAFPLAGLLTKVNVQTLAKLSALNLTKSYMRGYTVCIAMSFVTSTRGEFCESIKKGSTTNAALWSCVSADHLLGVSALVLCCAISMIARISSAALVPISSIFPSDARALLRLEISLFSSLSFRRRRSISPCMAATMKPALLSPSIFTVSIPPITSCGTRTVVSCDFAFLLGVAIAETPLIWCVSIYTKNEYIKTLMCISYLIIVKHTLSTGKAQAVHKIAKPSSALTLTGPLTTNDSQRIEVVMSKHTTPLNGRNAHTQDSEHHPVFIWLIAAVRRDSPSIVAVIHHIPAESEKAARRTLSKEHVCFFAGRLNVPRQEEGHA